MNKFFILLIITICLISYTVFAYSFYSPEYQIKEYVRENISPDWRMIKISQWIEDDKYIGYDVFFHHKFKKLWEEERTDLTCFYFDKRTDQLLYVRDLRGIWRKR